MRIGILTIDPQSIIEIHPFDSEGRDNASYEPARNALEQIGHNAEMIYITPENITLLDKQKYDILLNICDEGFCNLTELEPHVPAYLDVIGIPYAGSNHFTLALCLDKPMTKALLLHHGITTPKFKRVNSEEDDLSDLSLPIIIKPAREDGSIGIRDTSIIREPGLIKSRVKEMLSRYSTGIFCEEYIEGREFNVAVLGRGNDLEVLPVSELDFSKLPEGYEKICSYEAKWKTGSPQYKGTNSICPANIPEELRHKLISLALESVKITGCQDYARVDFRVDASGNPYVIEVNPNPDISHDAGLAKMAKTAGITYGQLLEKILKTSLKHQSKPDGIYINQQTNSQS